MIESLPLSHHSDPLYPEPRPGSSTPFDNSAPYPQVLYSPHKSIDILQLNCNNRKDTTYSVLETEKSAIAILLQEPWTNPVSFLPPTHASWHLISPLDNPPSQPGRPRCGIYINKSIPSYDFHRLPENSQLLTAVSLTISTQNSFSLRLLSVYNPPSSFEGIPVLASWLQSHYVRSIPTTLMIDSNLHHPMWNPPTYHHTHAFSKDLIRLLGSKGFVLTSPRGIPTFLNSRFTDNCGFVLD